MSRELRTRLESAQGRAKSLRESLPAMSELAPLPEDLQSLEQLSRELKELETERAARTERIARARSTRDEAARKVLRLEPIDSPSHKGIPASLALGLLSGVALVSWGADLPLIEAWPRLSAAVAMGLSTLVLLRGAWHTGRVSGARGPR